MEEQEFIDETTSRLRRNTDIKKDNTLIGAPEGYDPSPNTAVDAIAYHSTVVDGSFNVLRRALVTHLHNVKTLGLIEWLA